MKIEKIEEAPVDNVLSRCSAIRKSIFLVYFTLNSRTMHSRSKGGGGHKGLTKGGSQTVRVEKKLQTDSSKLTQLRQALFNDDGSERNVFLPYEKAFGNFSEKLKIRFETCKGLSKKHKNVLFSMKKEAFENIYNESGYKWKDYEEKEDLFDKTNRFLLMEEFENPDDPGEIVAFVVFSFSLQGAFCCLCYSLYNTSALG